MSTDYPILHGILMLLLFPIMAAVLVLFWVAYRRQANAYLPPDAPEIDEQERNHIEGVARAAARLDHVRGHLSNRRGPYAQNTQAHEVWTDAYLAQRSTLEERERERERRRVADRP